MFNKEASKFYDTVCKRKKHLDIGGGRMLGFANFGLIMHVDLKISISKYED